MKKTVVVLQHNGGQLCNQLWNFISIYAYCLEKEYECRNYSFFEYSKYFNIPIKNKLIDFLFFKPFLFLNSSLPFRVARKINRVFYSFFVALVRLFKKGQVIRFSNRARDVYSLPPTQYSKNRLSGLERNNKVKTIYFDGWLFRNPVGITKYRKEIIKYFQPREVYKAKVDRFITGLRQKYVHIVGVHIRQKVPGDGQFDDIDGMVYIFKKDMGLVCKTLKEYLLNFKREPSQTCFVICSNKRVETSLLKDLNVVVAGGNLVEDLYVLSKTDVIIGANSTFGAFASYYGNIPLVVFQNKIDWDYYRNNETCCFRNKYCTVAKW